MQFTEEYNYLTNLKKQCTFSKAFIFESVRVRILFENYFDSKFFNVVLSNNNYTYVKNYILIQDNKMVYINGYIENLFDIIPEIATGENNNLKKFYSALSAHILSIDSKDVIQERIQHILTNDNEIVKSRKILQDLKLCESAIYFKNLRRDNISPFQFEKVKKLLSYEHAKFCKNHGVTVVFTTNPKMQRTFSLNEYLFRYLQENQQ